ncbi:CBF/Mak21 family-domain-containing protein [Xylariales sp. PMI_506]|nr:CBF/Mak21 family-domain-containing protein [Xylariales sp. PMI_506]
MAAFDDAALASLTSKIDKKLSEKGKDKKKPQSQASPQAKPNLKRKRQEDKTEQVTKKRNDPPKRETNGQHKKQNKHDKKASKPASNGAISSDVNVLLEEIKALGGDEKDLELVGDIESEDETFGDASNTTQLDKSFQAELAKFASALGFEKVQPEELEEEEEDAEGEEGGKEDQEEADEDEEWEEDSEDGEDEAEDEEVEAVKPTAKTNASAQPAVKGKWKTIFEPRPDWHAVDLAPLPEPSSDDISLHLLAISNLKNYANSLLTEDSATHNATISSSSSHRFMSTIMSSGTISDKTSALTLAIQESPVHSIKPLENLMALAAKRSRGQALSASAALVDLLGPGSLLPSNRRLHPFNAQPGLIGTLQKLHIKSWSSGQALPGKITKEHLISWAFEDWLKQAYFKILQSLETWCNDEVEYARSRSIDMVYALLKEKPEQESNLLRLLVNKLGDRERKIASRASYLLLQLLNIHPGMKAVIVRAVEQEVIFRSGQSIRAKYYAINTLNQTILTSKEPQIADSLLNIYFGLFVALLKGGELGALGDVVAAPKTNFKKKRRSSGPPKKPEPESDAAHGEREAAEKLVSSILTGINRAVPFSETDSSTLETHLDTLFRITHSSNFNTSIQALMLIQQMATTRHLATERFYRTLYESLLDPRLMTSSKQALYLNLLYRSLKSDVDVRRVKAFVKRMLQILNLHQPSFVCGIIYLIMELHSTFPDISTLLNEAEENDDEDDNVNQVEGTDGLDAPEGPPTSTSKYDGRKRVPEYSNAHRSCLWELVPFLRHFHPSVDLYAASLLNGQKPAQKPELSSHTLINFLDKFVYKNPKATDGARGHSLMQPVAATGQGNVLVSSKTNAKAAGSINTAEFWNKKAEDVAAEDVFFHEYFSQIGKPSQDERKKKKKAKKDAADAEDEDSEAGEDEIWEALKSSKPEVQGDSESEMDSDFEELMGLDDSDAEDLDEDQDEMDVDGASDGGDLDMSDVSSLDFSDEDDDEAEGGAPVSASKEAASGKPESEQKKRRKMLKGLPTFASIDDYAEMLAQEEDGL